jgi:hypothetical protein
VGHQRVQRGEVVVFQPQAIGAKQCLERLLADADVDPEHAGSIQIRDAVVLVVRGSKW